MILLSDSSHLRFFNSGRVLSIDNNMRFIVSTCPFPRRWYGVVRDLETAVNLFNFCALAAMEAKWKPKPWNVVIKEFFSYSPHCLVTSRVNLSIHREVINCT